VDHFTYVNTGSNGLYAKSVGMGRHVEWSAPTPPSPALPSEDSSLAYRTELTVDGMDGGAHQWLIFNNPNSRDCITNFELVAWQYTPADGSEGNGGQGLPISFEISSDDTSWIHIAPIQESFPLDSNPPNTSAYWTRHIFTLNQLSKVKYVRLNMDLVEPGWYAQDYSTGNGFYTNPVKMHPWNYSLGQARMSYAAKCP